MSDIQEQQPEPVATAPEPAPRKGRIRLFPALHEHWTVWLALLVILVAGAALRAWYFTELRHAPDFTALRQDLDVQDYQARAMLSGDWRVRPGVNDPKIPSTPYYRPPGYTYFLSAVYAMSGGSYAAPRIVHFLLGLATVLLLFAFTRKYFGVAVGLLTAAFFATFWCPIYFEGEVNDPALFDFLIPALLIGLMRWYDKRTFLRAASVGVLAGLYALMRPNILLFGPVMAAWMLYVCWRGKMFWYFVPSWAGLLLATLLTIAPVTLRNYIVSGEFVPISTYFGENLQIGNNPDADGYTPWNPYLQELEGTGNFSVWDYDNIVRGLGRAVGNENLTHSEASKVFAQQAIAYIKAHPWETLRLTVRKALYFWAPEEITGNKVVQYEKDFYAPLKYMPGFWLLFGLFLAGLTILLTDWTREKVRTGDTGDVAASEHAVFLILAFIFVYFVSFLPFFVNARARAPLCGLMFLVGMYGVMRTLALFANRKILMGLVCTGLYAAALYFATISWLPYTPDRARWYHDRADSYLRAGRVEEAREAATAMLNEDMMHYMPQRLGIGFARAGDHAAALDMFRAALKVHPEEQNPRYRQDLIYHEAVELSALGRNDEAVERFHAALELNPKDPRAHNDLALLFEKMGRIEDATTQYRESMEARPDFALPYLNVANLELQRGERDAAIATLRLGIEKAPQSAEVPYQLGFMLMEMGETRAAIENYHIAIERNPDDPRPYNNIAWLRAQEGNTEEAASYYRKAIAADAKFVLAYANLGDLYANQGAYDEALDMYGKGIAADPKNAGLHNAAGYVLAQRGDVNGARKHFEEALRLAPDFVRARINLASLLASQGQDDEAESLLQEGLEHTPEDPALHFQLAGFLNKQGEPDAAADHYEATIAAEPGNVDARCALGAIRETQGRLADALEHYRQVLSLYPANETARAGASRLSFEKPQ